MPRFTLRCQDCGRSRDFHKLDHTPVYDFNAMGKPYLKNIEVRCEGGCKPAPGGFWDRLGQSSLSDIFHRRLFRAKEVFDD